jgi:hypothetical protein
VDPARELADPGVPASSLTNALPYWAVVGDALLLRDGSYELGFACELPHLDTMSDAELEVLHRRLMRVVDAVPAGERLRFTYVRTPAPEAAAEAFATSGGRGAPGNARLHRHRVEALREAIATGQVAARELLVSVTYRPPRTRPSPRWVAAALVGGTVALVVGLAGRWWAGLVAGAAAAYAVVWLSGARARRPFTPIPPSELSRDAREIAALRGRLLAAMDAAGLAPRPLRAEEYLRWAWRYFNPGRAAAGLPAPPLPNELLVDLPHGLVRRPRGHLGGGWWLAPATFRQLVASAGLVRDEQHLFLDGYTIQVLAMDALPVGETVMNSLGPLLAAATPLWVIVDLVRDPRGAALRRLMLRQRLLRSIATSEIGAGEPAALRGMEKVAEAQWRLSGGETDIVRIGCGVVIAAPTPEAASERASRVLSWFTNEMADARMVVEDAGLARTFFALAPFSGQIMPRTRAAEAENAVDFMPLAGPPRGSERPVMLLRTRYRSLVALDPFDPRLPAYNAVLAGPTGSGKTMFAIGLALHASSSGARVIVVDRGSNTPPGPWLTATRAVGGQYITFDPAGGVAINPCDLPAGELEPDKAKLSFLVTLVSRLASERGEALGAQERNVIQAAVRQAYARKVHEAAGPEGPRPVLEPVFLRDVVATLRNLGVVAGTQDVSEEDRAVARRLATRLYQWVDRGRYADLLDRPTTVDLTEDWVLFDTSALGQEPELLPVAMLLITDLIWRHVAREVGRRPTLVVLDEVWALLADRIAGDFIQDLYRRLRTTGSGVLSVSQDLGDFRASEHALAILTNAQTYYLTRPADPEYTGGLLRCNDRQVRQLASLGMTKGRFGELMVIHRFGDRQAAFTGVYVPTPQDRWIAESEAATRLLRERYVREYGDVLAAVQALARDIPSGMPRTAAPAGREGTHAREGGR